MHLKWFWFIITVSLNAGLYAQVPNRPFPQHVAYAKGSIKPNHVSQDRLDKLTLSFYQQWKKQYIKPGCHPGEYFVWFERKGDKQCVSEGQGYGMVITALMAGADKSAKTTYDGLYRYYKNHPANHPHLMAWAQTQNCRDLDKSTASDGDMDIAYSLLLADKQWGSNGKVNYMQEARKIIASILHYEINPHTYSILISDAIAYDSKDYYDTRTSDFMPSNLKAFENATYDIKWKKVIDKNYKLFNYMQQAYSPDAGLVPDFIRHVNKKALPAQPNYLESPYDGYYNYNACRVPWRIATDYLLTGDKRAKIFNDRINKWVRETTQNKPDNLSAGYTLAGNDIKHRYFEALSFIGPFTVSAMTDKKNQQWLNDVWDYLVNFKLKDYDYYDNSIKLLNMIIISGNYWQ